VKIHSSTSPSAWSLRPSSYIAGQDLNDRARTATRWKAAIRACLVLALPLLALPAAPAAAQGEVQSIYGFYTVTPCRIADTRDTNGPYGGPALSANTDRTIVVAGRCGIPSTAESIVLNVTVTGSTQAGDLRLYPSGSSPSQSTAINYAAGKTRANNGSYGVGSNGALVLHCDQVGGTVNAILDVSGYFETTPVTGGGGASPWSRRAGDVSDDRGAAVAIDGQGRVAVTGHFDGTTNFGGGTVTSYTHPTLGPTVDVFVAEYSASGAHLWSRVIGSDGPEEAKGIATDASGNVLLTGYQGSYALDFGGGPQYSHGGNDLFFAKYSPTGGWIWSKTIGGQGFDQGNAIAADAAGNVYATGYIGVGSGGVDFGGGPLSSAGMYDVFLVKYSPSGQHIWSKRFGGSGNDTGMAISTDSSGNVIVAGSFEGSVDFGGGTLQSSGSRDVFVAKYSSTGAHLWSKKFGGSGDEVGYGVVVDTAGDVFVSGKFQSTVNFGGSALASAGGDDIFLVKLSGSNGSHVWSKGMGSTSGDASLGVDVDGSGNVVMTGYFTGSVNFGGGALSSSGLDVFVAKYSSSGTHISSRRFGGFDTQIGNSVAVAPTGEISVAGYFAATIDFGNGVLTSAGTYDMFVAGIGP
jgi:hypothetical protein